MQPRWTVYLCVAVSCWLAGRVTAQSSYPTAGASGTAWGGRVLPSQVPYQPTLVSNPPAMAGAPVVTYGLPSGGTAAAIAGEANQNAAYTLQGPVALPPVPTDATNAAQPWQPYAELGAPTESPPVPLQEPLFPDAPSSGLRPLPRPADARDGVFQKAKFTATWIPPLDDDSLGWTDLRSEIVFGLPFFTRETPILITPSYELHLLEGPIGFDLPPRLHDLVIDFNHFRRVTDNWIANIAVAPGYYTDDHSFDSDDALRINGRAVAVYDPSPEWKGVLGATYVHGGWAKIVPVVGVVYEPNDDVKYELVFPRPRVAWRLPNSPVPGRDEFWFYVLGEFGNSIWAFEQSDGTPDMLASRDWRAIIGLERKIIGGLSHRVELGYVFNREIKLASDGTEIDLDDSVLLRVGLVY
jgi:hypothetical protein